MPGQTSVFSSSRIFRLQESFKKLRGVSPWDTLDASQRISGASNWKVLAFEFSENNIEYVMFRAQSVNRTDQSFSSTFPVQDFWWFREKKLRNAFFHFTMRLQCIYNSLQCLHCKILQCSHCNFTMALQWCCSSHCKLIVNFTMILQWHHCIFYSGFTMYSESSVSNP